MPIQSHWRRLTSKPIGELAGRLASALRSDLERRRYHQGGLTRRDRLKRALGRSNAEPAELLAARRIHRPPLVPSLACRDRMRALLTERYQHELEATRLWANRAVDHEFHFFGRVHRL